VPAVLIKHICQHFKVSTFPAATLQQYDRSGSKSLHQRKLREFVGLRLLDIHGQAWLDDEALKAAHTKQELPDIINILLEELVHHRYLLPGYDTLSRIARRARVQVNDQIYKLVSGKLSAAQQDAIDRMFRTRQGRSQWDQLKREPKQPSVREVASFLTHIQTLRERADGLPVVEGVAVSKRTQMVLEARALNIREMQDLKPAKRYTLAVLLVRAQLQKAVNDIADIFIRSVRNMHNAARERLKQYQLEHVAEGEALIAQFREVLIAVDDDGTDPQRVGRIRKLLDDDPAAWIERCDEHTAYAGNN
jgi:Domain of unknown function (DUF4158)